MYLESLERVFNMLYQKSLEHDKSFEVIERRLEERDRKFNEIPEEVRKIWETLAEHNRGLSNVENVLGAQ